MDQSLFDFLLYLSLYNPVLLIGILANIVVWVITWVLFVGVGGWGVVGFDADLIGWGLVGFGVLDFLVRKLILGV